MKTFAKLAQANVDHYNNNPSAHKAVTIAYAVIAAVAINKLIKEIAEPKTD